MDHKCLNAVTFPPLGTYVFPLGMGCASLGSRVAGASGLAALEKAYDAGVRWFDVAPPYGAGQAELILGRFLARHPEALVCTKVGLAPPERNGLLRITYTLARPIASKLKGLRKAFRHLPSTRNQHLPLSAELIRTSLDQSLAKLQRSHVDVFALHDPSPEDINRTEILDALHAAKRAGKARAIAVAGSLPACLAAAQIGDDLFTVFQLADPIDSGALEKLRNKLGTQTNVGFVLHSVFGIGGETEKLAARLANEPALRQAADGAGIISDGEMAAREILLRRALTRNDCGPVLLSMFGRGHLDFALATAKSGPLPLQLIALLDPPHEVAT